MARDLLCDLSASPVEVLPTDGSGGRGRMTAKVGNSDKRRFYFQEDGAVADPPAGVTGMVLEVREQGDYDGGDPLLRVVTFSEVDPGGGEAKYLEYDAVWTGTDLEAVLDNGGSPKQKAALIGELTWETAAGVRSTEEFPVEVWNDLVKDLQAATVPLPAVPTMEDWLAARAMRYHPELTGLTGGGATKLDGLATADDALPVGYIAVLESLGLATPYVLTDSDEAEDGTVYVRADDYAPGTNERVWQWMGWWTAAVYSAGYAQFSKKMDFGQPLVPDDPVDLRHTRGVVESHGVRTLADAASIAWSAGSFAVVTLGGNRTLGKPAHAVSGAARLRLQITQDGTGNRTLAYAAGITFAGGVAPALSTAAGAVDVLELVTFDSGATWRARLEEDFG